MISHIFIDGAARVKPHESKGEAACAAVIYKNKKPYISSFRGLGKRTNNEAEYEALIHGLSIAISAGIETPTIFSDSATVCNHVNRKWKCLSPILQPLLYTVELMKVEYQFNLVQVNRSQVREADALCNEFLDRFENFKERGVI